MKPMPGQSNVFQIYSAEWDEYDEDSRAVTDTMSDAHIDALLALPEVMWHFPVHLANGTRIDAPRFQCRKCSNLIVPHGRIRRYDRAVLIQAAARCEHCQVYTCFDARVLDDGTLYVLDYPDPGRDAYAGKIHTPGCSPAGGGQKEQEDEGDPEETWLLMDDKNVSDLSDDDAVVDEEPQSIRSPSESSSPPSRVRRGLDWMRRLTGNSIS
ncbi:hypothetical protein [Thiomonas sp.]